MLPIHVELLIVVVVVAAGGYQSLNRSHLGCSFVVGEVVAVVAGSHHCIHYL